MAPSGRNLLAGAARSVVTKLTLAGFVLAACQSTSRIGDRYYERGRFPEAAAALEHYLETGPTDAEAVARSLYRLGVIFALPGSPTYDPSRSIEVLERLLNQHPESPFSTEGGLLRELQLDIVELRRESQVNRQRLKVLESELSARQSRLQALEADLKRSEDELVTLKESIPPLRLEIRYLIRELAAKEGELEQLERLKAIDLEQPPP